MLLIRINTVILVLAVSNADIKPEGTLTTAQKRQDDDYNCESIGPWKPMFKPSPIVHSELPEHRSLFNVYSSRSDVKLLPHILVPVVNPVAYSLHHDFGSQEQPELKYSLIDSSVRESTDSNGKPVIKWDHYGDIKQVSVKYKGGSPKNKKNTNRLYNQKADDSKSVTDSRENKSKEVQSKEEERHKHSEENSQQLDSEINAPCEENEEDEKYFNSGSFFDGSFNSEENMDVSKDFSDFNDISQEDVNKHNHLGENMPELPTKDYNEAKKPATSYAFISSLFSGIKKSHYSNLNMNMPPVKSPYSNTFTNFNGQGRAHFVVHDKPNTPWLKQLNTKFNKEKTNSYQEIRTPHNVHEYQADETMSYGYPTYSQRSESYYPLNKDYLLGDFWKYARRMEKMSPPSPGQTSTWFMNDKFKKPRTLSFSRGDLINSKKPFSYVYIIKTNKVRNPIFINHKRK